MLARDRSLPYTPLTLAPLALDRSKAKWFQCDQPSEEASYTCFLTPSYMSNGTTEGGKWTCTTGDSFPPTGEE